MTKLEEQIMIDEGFRSKPYLDTVGKLTIGYGRNLDDVGISKAEAYAMLQNDIKKVTAELRSKIHFFGLLSDGRQNALINMAFNMGVSKLLGFKKTLALMEKGDFDEASREVLRSKWASQVGQRAVRISEKIKTGS